MRKSLNRALNLGLYLSFCLLTATGLLLAFRLPPGSRGGRGLSFLAMDRHDWADVHTWISYGFIVLIVIHLIMHYQWLLKIAGGDKRWRLWTGLAAGLGIVLLVFILPVESRFTH